MPPGWRRGDRVARERGARADRMLREPGRIERGLSTWPSRPAGIGSPRRCSTVGATSRIEAPSMRPAGASGPAAATRMPSIAASLLCVPDTVPLAEGLVAGLEAVVGEHDDDVLRGRRAELAEEVVDETVVVGDHAHRMRDLLRGVGRSRPRRRRRPARGSASSGGSRRPRRASAIISSANGPMLCAEAEEYVRDAGVLGPHPRRDGERPAGRRRRRGDDVSSFGRTSGGWTRLPSFASPRRSPRTTPRSSSRSLSARSDTTTPRSTPRGTSPTIRSMRSGGPRRRRASRAPARGDRGS